MFNKDFCNLLPEEGGVLHQKDRSTLGSFNFNLKWNGVIFFAESGYSFIKYIESINDDSHFLIDDDITHDTFAVY